MGTLIIDAVRTPMGRFGGALAPVRPDDLAAHVIAALVQRNSLPTEKVDDVVWGAANQAGEDDRNVARMAALLAGLPVEVPGATVNRLCGSGLEAVNCGHRAIRAGEAELVIAAESESMSRAPYVVSKPSAHGDVKPSSTTRRSGGVSSTLGSHSSTGPMPWARPPRRLQPSTALAARSKMLSRSRATVVPCRRARRASSKTRSSRSKYRSARENLS